MAGKLYLETRLYNVNDRLSSLDLCEHIDSWIDQGFLGEMEHCFLPYRDSDNAPVEEDADPGKVIFDTDIINLRACNGIAGYFDGAHYDSGCAFEIGCGYAWGYPIHLISTDFQKWSVGDSDTYYVASKLLEYIAALTYLSDSDGNIRDYRKRQEDFRSRVLKDFKTKLTTQFGGGGVKREPLQALDVIYDYYIDPNLQYTEPGRWLLGEITGVIENAGKSWIIGDNRGDIAEEIDRLRSSGRAIFYDDYFEFNVDSGILHGIAYGIGRPPIVYSSNVQTCVAGGEPEWLNVMIRYSADVVTSLKELRELIEQGKKEE